MSYWESLNQRGDDDESPGQTVAASLWNITSNKYEEYVKVKMQELIFQS